MVMIDLGHWQVTHTVPTSLTVSRARPNSMRSVVIARRQRPTPCPRVPGIRFPCGGWKLTGAPAFGVSAIMESVASRYSNLTTAQGSAVARRSEPSPVFSLHSLSSHEVGKGVVASAHFLDKLKSPFLKSGQVKLRRAGARGAALDELSSQSQDPAPQPQAHA
jgi:hypothetical protein